MENLILTDDFDSYIALKEVPSQKVRRLGTNAKVIKLILKVLPNKIVYGIGKYKNAHDL